MSSLPRANTNRCGVLLLAHGAPDRVEDVPEFLLNIRGGRKLPDHVVREIMRRYELIGGGSPLLQWTRKQADALAARLGCPVYVGMRNWMPFIADAVAQAAREGVSGLVTICLAPQNSRTSVGLYRRRLEESITQSGTDLRVEFVESWHDQVQLVHAYSEKLRAGLTQAEEAAGGEVPVILTAHSVPEKTIVDGDPYDQQVKETAAMVAASAGVKRWRFAYQSQGMTADPWMGPKVEAEIDALAKEGSRHVFVAPTGFLCDHVEILYDVDILFRNHARDRGVTLWRSESLNDSPLLIEALASIAGTRMRLCSPA